MIILLHWVISSLILLLVAYIVPGIVIQDFGVALFSAFVLGLVNVFVKPIMDFLTLPINILTMGVFTFVVNGLMLYLTAAMVPGFIIQGFIPALLGSILLTFLDSVVDSITDGNSSKPIH